MEVDLENETNHCLFLQSQLQDLFQNICTKYDPHVAHSDTWKMWGNLIDFRPLSEVAVRGKIGYLLLIPSQIFLELSKPQNILNQVFESHEVLTYEFVSLMIDKMMNGVEGCSIYEISIVGSQFIQFKPVIPFLSVFQTDGDSDMTRETFLIQRNILLDFTISVFGLSASGVNHFVTKQKFSQPITPIVDIFIPMNTFPRQLYSLFQFNQLQDIKSHQDSILDSYSTKHLVYLLSILYKVPHHRNIKHIIWMLLSKLQSIPKIHNEVIQTILVFDIAAQEANNPNNIQSTLNQCMHQDVNHSLEVPVHLSILVASLCELSEKFSNTLMDMEFPSKLLSFMVQMAVIQSANSEICAVCVLKLLTNLLARSTSRHSIFIGLGIENVLKEFFRRFPFLKADVSSLAQRLKLNMVDETINSTRSWLLQPYPLQNEELSEVEKQDRIKLDLNTLKQGLEADGQVSLAGKIYKSPIKSDTFNIPSRFCPRDSLSVESISARGPILLNEVYSSQYVKKLTENIQVAHNDIHSEDDDDQSNSLPSRLLKTNYLLTKFNQTVSKSSSISLNSLLTSDYSLVLHSEDANENGEANDVTRQSKANCLLFENEATSNSLNDGAMLSNISLSNRIDFEDNKQDETKKLRVKYYCFSVWKSHTHKLIEKITFRRNVVPNLLCNLQLLAFANWLVDDSKWIKEYYKSFAERGDKKLTTISEQTRVPFYDIKYSSHHSKTQPPMRFEFHVKTEVVDDDFDHQYVDYFFQRSLREMKPSPYHPTSKFNTSLAKGEDGAWKKIGREEWHVVRDSRATTISRTISPSARIKRIENISKYLTQPICVRKNKRKNDLARFCLLPADIYKSSMVSWVELMVANEKYLSKLSINSCTQDISDAKKFVADIHLKRLNLQFEVREKLALRNGITNISDWQSISTPSMTAAHLPEFQVFWWYLSGKYTHVEHISQSSFTKEQQQRIIARTERSKQSLQSKHSQRSKRLFEKPNWKFFGNIVSDEEIQSGIDQERVRTYLETMSIHASEDIAIALTETNRRHAHFAHTIRRESLQRLFHYVSKIRHLYVMKHSLAIILFQRLQSLKQQRRITFDANALRLVVIESEGLEILEHLASQEADRLREYFYLAFSMLRWFETIQTEFELNLECYKDYQFHFELENIQAKFPRPIQRQFRIFLKSLQVYHKILLRNLVETTTSELLDGHGETLTVSRPVPSLQSTQISNYLLQENQSLRDICSYLISIDTVQSLSINSHSNLLVQVLNQIRNGIFSLNERSQRLLNCPSVERLNYRISNYRNKSHYCGIHANRCTNTFYSIWKNFLMKNDISYEYMKDVTTTGLHVMCAVLLLSQFLENNFRLQDICVVIFKLLMQMLEIESMVKNDPLLVDALSDFFMCYRTIHYWSDVRDFSVVDWEDTIHHLMVSIFVALIMLCHDPNEDNRAEIRLLIMEMNIGNVLVQVMQQTTSISVMFWAMQVIYQTARNEVEYLLSFTGESNLQILHLESKYKIALNFPEIVTVSMKLTRAKGYAANKDFNVVVCRFVKNIELKLSKAVLNIWLNIGLLNDVVVANSIFNWRCFQVGGKRVPKPSDNADTAKNNKIIKYLTPLEVILNPPIDGYTVEYYRMEDSIGIVKPLESVDPESLQEHEEGKLMEIVPSQSKLSENVSQNLNHIPVKKGIFKFPMCENGMYKVRVFANTVPPMQLSEHNIPVKDGESSVKVLDSGSNGVATSFWSSDKPLSGATVTGEFISSFNKSTYTLNSNTSSDGTVVFPLPAGIIEGMEATKAGNTVKRKDPVQVPAPVVQKQSKKKSSAPPILRPMIINEISVGATSMTGCLRHLKARGCQKLVVLGDRSGSMSGTRLECLKKSFLQVLDFCKLERKQCALGIWDDKTRWCENNGDRTWLSPEVKFQYDFIANWIREISSGGSTVLRQAVQSAVTNYRNITDIWIITDGESVWDNDESWEEYCKDLKFKNIVFHFTALGGEADALNLEKMRNVSSEGRGFFSVVDTASAKTGKQNYFNFDVEQKLEANDKLAMDDSSVESDEENIPGVVSDSVLAVVADDSYLDDDIDENVLLALTQKKKQLMNSLFSMNHINSMIETAIMTHVEKIVGITIDTFAIEASDKIATLVSARFDPEKEKLRFTQLVSELQALQEGLLDQTRIQTDLLKNLTQDQQICTDSIDQTKELINDKLAMLTTLLQDFDAKQEQSTSQFQEEIKLINQHLTADLTQLRSKCDQIMNVSSQILVNEGNIPCTPLLLPADMANIVRQLFTPNESVPAYKKMWNKLTNRQQLKSLNPFYEDLYLYFVSPISGRIAPTNNGQGLRIKIPTKLGLTISPILSFAEGLIRVSIFALGAAMGIPGPTSALLSCIPFGTNNIFKDMHYYQNTLRTCGVFATISTSCLESSENLVLEEEMFMSVEDELDRASKGWTDITKLAIDLPPVVCGNEYARLIELLSHIEISKNDPVLIAEGSHISVKKSGLNKVLAEDGTLMWVLEEEAEEYRKVGAAALHSNVKGKLRGNHL